MNSRESLIAETFFGAVAIASLFLMAAVFPRRRFTQAADSLIVLILAIFVWCATYAVSFAPVSLRSAGLWLDATYIGALTAPAAVTFFVARYSKLDAWLTPFVRKVLIAVPALFAVAIYVPLFRPYFLGEGRNPATAVLDHPGITYWLYLVYVSCLMVFATGLVIRFVRRTGAIRRSSGVLLLCAMSLPWLASIVSSANLFVLGVDPTVVSLGVTTAIFAYLVLREKILDVGQLAREEILNSMRDGFIALDNAQVVVDANDRALELLGLPLNNVLHRPLRSVLQSRPALLEVALERGGGLVRVDETTAHERLLLIETLPLTDRDHNAVGSTLVLRDQTRIYVDELTRIGNRRYFFDQVPHLVSVCQRSGLPVSLSILDLDGLKAVNDGYGHLTGDIALKRVADAIRASVRDVDVVARMSGDEFVALMPGATEEQAVVIIERVRETLSRDTRDLRVTISAGIAQVRPDDSLLHAIAAADRALYDAKARGRDCVVRFSEGENQP